MLWSHVYGEQVLVASFKEQEQGSLGSAEPWCSPWGYVWWREGISCVFGAEGKTQNLEALTVLDGVHLSLLPEKNGFVRVCYSCRVLCESSLLSEHVKRCICIAGFWQGLKFAQRKFMRGKS